MGKPREHEIPWTPLDDLVLTQGRADRQPYARIARALGRTLGSVQARASKLRMRERCRAAIKRERRR